MWTWNETNNEYWNKGTFENREKAIADAKDSGLTDFYIGECEIIPLRTDADPDRIMEELDELYHNDSGSEDYLYEGVTDEERTWLENKLSKLMYEFHKRAKIEPSWYRVFSEEHIEL